MIVNIFLETERKFTEFDLKDERKFTSFDSIIYVHFCKTNLPRFLQPHGRHPVTKQVRFFTISSQKFVTSTQNTPGISTVRHVL